MTVSRLAIVSVVSVFLVSCASNSEKGTIAQLRDVQLDLTDEKIEGGIEKAMQGYKKFLEETPESAMTPEAMRRLADLKIEKEYGLLEGPVVSTTKTDVPKADPMDRPEKVVIADISDTQEKEKLASREDESDFEARTTQMNVPQAPDNELAGPGSDLSNQGAEEAITLYKELLEKYPHYERNDQVLYQLTRAYEELGEVEEATRVMDRIVAEYPDSRYIDEIQFRRGEFYFVRKKYLDAEEAYLAIVNMGSGSFYYEMALYKLGWTFYKQDMHEEAMNQFVALLDYKVDTGYDFQNPTDEFEQKRIEDTHRVISLSLSAMGGPESVVAYFDKNGERSYEVDIYRNLGEYYLDKRRYADAASAYKTFVGLNPFHKVAPHFDMRVIEIYKKGGFPKLVIDANKEFSTSYGLKSDYWRQFEVGAYPEVLSLLKATLIELANYYHALYQNKQFMKERPDNFGEAQHWYHEFLESFPKVEESPVMNYQLADLLLENKSYHAAAVEYERTAYEYPEHEKASEAGYAAVYTHRENLKAAPEKDKLTVKRDVIRSSLRFSNTFPQHDKASLVMGAALEDIFAMKDYPFAVTTGRRMLEMFPQASDKQRRAAWLVVAHSSFELSQYADSEEGYKNVLQLTKAEDESYEELTENLAASIYKQGEQANTAENFQLAADHFLRLGIAAPYSKLRPAAEYDAATALMKLENWARSAEVLKSFRQNYPEHKLQADVTIKLAQVYSESGRLAEAAAEYERIESESDDDAVRRESLKVAAGLYIQVGDKDKAIQVYRRFIEYFPIPHEPVMEMHNSIAGILKGRGDIAAYHTELERIVAIYHKPGVERSDRMRYLAGTSALTLTEPMFETFAGIELVQPLKVTLQKKRHSMKVTKEAFQKLLDYELGDVTAAATFYIAEMYYNFSRALLNSERPNDMNDLELDQYELMLDEQSYPFEEKAISIHKKNVGFIGLGVYNNWVDKSITKLAAIVPGRYARFEESSGFLLSASNVDYSELTNPLLPPAEPSNAETAIAATGDSANSDQEIGLEQASTSNADALGVDAEATTQASSEVVTEVSVEPVEGGEPESGVTDDTAAVSTQTQPPVVNKKTNEDGGALATASVSEKDYSDPQGEEVKVTEVTGAGQNEAPQSEEIVSGLVDGGKAEEKLEFSSEDKATASAAAAAGVPSPALLNKETEPESEENQVITGESSEPDIETNSQISTDVSTTQDESGPSVEAENDETAVQEAKELKPEIVSVQSSPETIVTSDDKLTTTEGDGAEEVNNAPQQEGEVTKNPVEQDSASAGALPEEADMVMVDEPPAVDKVDRENFDKDMAPETEMQGEGV